MHSGLFMQALDAVRVSGALWAVEKILEEQLMQEGRLLTEGNKALVVVCLDEDSQELFEQDHIARQGLVFKQERAGKLKRLMHF